MDNNEKGLGQGLSALIRENRSHNNNHRRNIVVMLDILSIYPNALQPRNVFDEGTLNELAESIKSNGVIQPIIVRKNEDREGYEIIAGERRWRAAIIAQLKEIPAIIKDLNDKSAMALSIVENIQREDLSPIEEAKCYKRLIEEFLYRHEDLSGIVGKSRSYISNSLRLLSLPDAVQTLVDNKHLSTGHARTIINTQDPEKIANKIIEKNLNVRQTENLVRRENAKPSIAKVKHKSMDVAKLERKLSENLGLEVNITDNKTGGHIIIKFNNLEQLDLILSILNKPHINTSDE